ncbi:hypothetical protein [Halogranum rubrum]|uniref:Uncharacterized protein n=1 Tax=Halogranum salarium B-1 TaxID=1210908 RepID=J2ZB51_9EURY|nr:hypothetical protein [Halogranum salarium]EJN57880.1 hypothetical protein HSB1_32970 [Halogranum salarium B-1]
MRGERYEMHEPRWRGTADSDVSDVRVEEIEDGGATGPADPAHYLLSRSGFPPDDDADLELRVVDDASNLNRELLHAARHRLVELPGLDPIPKAVVDDRLVELLAVHFDETEEPRRDVTPQ